MEKEMRSLFERELSAAEREKAAGTEQQRCRMVVAGRLPLRREPVSDRDNELGQLCTGDLFAPKYYTVGEDGKGYAYGSCERLGLSGYVLSDYLE